MSEEQQIAAADLVIGLVSGNRNPQEISGAIVRAGEALHSLPGPPRTLIVHADSLTEHEPQDGLTLLPYPLPPPDPSSSAHGLTEGFRAVFTVAQKAGASACAIVASDLTTVTPDWISRLALPALDGRHDLVAPCYQRHRLEGLINRGIIYPLVRALFGKQVRNPFGPDFGISNRLLQRVLPGMAGRIHPIASLTTEAITAGLSVCQTHLGVRIYASQDWGNLSGILSQVLGPLFLEVERHAIYWQRGRPSEKVPEFGAPTVVTDHDGATDVTRLIESFELGTRNLQEIWSLVMPPSVLVDLRRMAKAAPDQFRIKDDHWARIVYDFALAHRLRTINRDHLLRAFTPLYLGWVASWAHEAGDPERRLEQLCVAFEEARPYFVARWRWPDRFNA